MDAPIALIFNKVNDLKEWERWGPWGKNDPNMNLVYAEKTSGQGASYSWESTLEGDGKITTIAIDENKSIDQSISFHTPIGTSRSDVQWKFIPNNNGTTEVIWGMKGEHSFLEKIFLSFEKEPFNASLKSMFDEGLTNLNDLVLDEMRQYSISVEGLKEHGGGYYLFITTACKINELASKMTPMLQRINDFAQQNQIAVNGRPFTIYNEWDDANGTVIFSSAVPVKDRIIITEGDILCGYLEPCLAVKTVLTGNYNHLTEAYKKAEDYILMNGLKINPEHLLFEVYINDSSSIQNPANWITEIYTPVVREMTQDTETSEQNLQ